MSKLTSQLRTAKTWTSKSSGFDQSNYRLQTGKTGQLVPIFCTEVLPRDKWSIGMMSQIDLPPAACAFQGRVDMRFEAFFVPNRLLWGGWQSFISMPPDNPYSFDILRPQYTPCISIPNGFNSNNLPYYHSIFGAGSLADSLGLRFLFRFSDGTSLPTGGPNLHTLGSATNVLVDNALPFLAYHRIWDDWYRDSRIQTPLFVNQRTYKGTSAESEPDSEVGVWRYPWLQMPEYSSDSDENLSQFVIKAAAGSNSWGDFYDGSSLFGFRQRNWADDLYTTCALYPQAAVSATNVEKDSDGNISIPNIRMANALQRFRERYNIAGQKYVDQIFTAWGVKPADANLQRPVYLGSFSHGVYSSPIFNASSTTTPAESSNPYNGELGSSAGSTSGFGKSSIVNDFEATEHGYIIILASLVPHAFYSAGIPEMFMRSQLGDFADPLLQGMGDQPVNKGEVTGSWETSSSSTFGYRQQYATYKYRNDEVCGLFRREGGGGALAPTNLAPFCLQRNINLNRSVGTGSTGPEIDSEFLRIPTDFLDQVLNVSTALAGYTWRGYFYFNVRAVRALADYVIPTLENTQHMRTMSVRAGGTNLNG